MAGRVALSSQRWAVTYAIDSEDHPLYKAFYAMYYAFFNKGLVSVASHEFDEYIVSLEQLRKSGKFVDKQGASKNTTYGGSTEIWLWCDEATGKPLAFITAQHFIPYARWIKAATESDPVPEMVYLAHFGSAERGAGKELLAALQADAWLGVTIMLEVENGIERAAALIAYYEGAGFVRCAELAPDHFWRFYLKFAAEQRYFQVRVRDTRKDLVLMTGDVCEVHADETFMLLVATDTTEQREHRVARQLEEERLLKQASSSFSLSLAKGAPERVSSRATLVSKKL
jgi:hypothetical protein